MLEKKKNLISLVLALCFTLSTCLLSNVQAVGSTKKTIQAKKTPVISISKPSAKNAIKVTLKPALKKPVKVTLKPVVKNPVKVTLKPAAKKPAKVTPKLASKKPAKVTPKPVARKPAKATPKPTAKKPAKVTPKPAAKKPTKVTPKPTVTNIPKSNSELILSKIKDYINEDNIMKTIEELSSQKYDGRATGTVGNDLATQYIADYFQKIGLESPKGVENFKQYYKQDVGILNSKPVLEVLDTSGKLAKTYNYRIDFSPALSYFYRLKGDITKELYIVASKEDFNTKLNSNKDKILLISAGLAKELTNLQNLVPTLGLNVIVETDNTKNGGYYLSSVYHPYSKYQGEYSGFYIRASLNTFKELVDFAKMGSKCHISHDMTVKAAEPANVIGVIPGSSSTLKNEFIVLSAHFDHLGNNFDSTYNYGAFDNASGTATIMEIARVIKAQKLKPEKTIVFAAFNGEETGLVGSKEFVNSSIIDLEHAVDINYDMVGFNGKTPYKIHGGYDKPTPNALKDEIAKLFNNNNMPCDTGEFPASDHVSFAAAGVPAVFIFDDNYTTYHSPNDKVETIDKFEIEDLITITFKYIFSDSNKKPFHYNSASTSKIKLTDYKGKISEANIMNIVKDLSSKEFDGREIGTDGNSKAAKYIADYFKRLGLSELDKAKSYQQEYDQFIVQEKIPSTLQILDKDKNVIKNFMSHKDFGIISTSYATLKDDLTDQMIAVKTKQEVLDNLNGLKGKVILVPMSLIVELNDDLKRILEAGVNIIVELVNDNNLYYYKNFYSGNITDTSNYGFVVATNQSNFKALYDASASGMLCHVAFDYSIKNIKAENILGVIPGNDEKLKDEYVVLAASFDAYGHNVDGTFNPGALFNASGTATIMEIARVIKENKLSPKRTIIIAAFNGSASENSGLKAFIENSVVDNKQASAISFIGYGDKSVSTLSTMIVGENNSSFTSKFMEVLDSANLRYTNTQYFFGATQQYKDAGIPALEITDMNYSLMGVPADVPENVDTAKIKTLINGVLNYILLEEKK